MKAKSFEFFLLPLTPASSAPLLPMLDSYFLSFIPHPFFMCASRKLPAKQQRAIELLLRLKQLYPDATCSLDYATPVQLLVATILSAQCTDVRVNMVTPELFRRFPDAAAMAGADLEEIEALVKSTGFFRNKAKNIQAACRMIMTEFGGEVPKLMEDLLKLPGVARKTANVVSAHAHGINLGVTVDTHVKRLTYRLGLTEHKDPIRIERDLMKLLPQPDWENWSIRVIYHGRAVCMARNPQCDRCTLADLCPSASLSQKPLTTPEPDDLAITPEHPTPPIAATLEKSEV